MADPIIREFARQYQGITDPQEREEVKRQFAEQVLAQQPSAVALRTLLDTSNEIGEDLTHWYSYTPSLPPVSPEEVKIRMKEKVEGAPFWRRAVGKAVGVAEWWQRNVTEPSAAGVLAVTFGLVPGKQGFEKRYEAALQSRAAQRAWEHKALSTGDKIAAARDAYRETKLPTGIKGLTEFLFDPLNLVGMGIPGKVAKAAPVLKPLMFPLKMIDEAPDVMVRKALEVPGKGVKITPKVASVLGLSPKSVGKGIPGLLDIPGVFQKHWSSQVSIVFNRTYAAVEDAFGPAKILSGNPTDTKELFSDLSRFPENAGPFSLRNLKQHIDASLTDAERDSFNKKLVELNPKDAAEFMAFQVAQLERKAILAGGVRVTGKEIVGRKVLRQQRLTSFLEKLHLDNQHAKAIAKGIDDRIFGWVDNTYLRKIEPNVVRPWALAHLTFAGFPFMNAFEDIGMAAAGLNIVGKPGVDDFTWTMKTVGLVGDAIPPQHLRNAERDGRGVLLAMMGAYKKSDPTTPIGKIADTVLKWPLLLSNRWSFAIRRATWSKLKDREMVRALEEIGVPKEQVDALKDFVHGELPIELAHMRNEVAGQVWSSIQSGNPQHVRELDQIFNKTRMINRAQASIVTEFPNLPPDARRKFLQTVFAEGVRPDNVDALMSQIRDEVIEWNKFTPIGIEARFEDFLQALGETPPRSPTAAANLLRMLQHAGDTLAALPREIRAHYREKARVLNPTERSKMFDESLQVIDESVRKLREMYNESLNRAEPHITRLLAGVTPDGGEAVSRSIRDIFTAYRQIGESVTKTWEEYRSRVHAHFESVPRGERDEAFWLEFERIGDEVWSAEKEFRLEQSNIARTGWNALLETIPSDLSRKDRDLLRYGIQAALGDATAKIDELRVMRAEQEQLLATTSDAQKPIIQQRIDRIDKAVLVAAQHKDELDKRLAEHIKEKGEMRPQILRDYDRAIAATKASIKQAKAAGMTEVLPTLEVQLARAEMEKAQALQAIIPPALRPRWDALQQQYSLLVSQGDKAGARRVRAQIRRLQKNIEEGEAFESVRRIAGLKNEVVNRLSLKLGEEGVPPTIDDLAERVSALAEQGDPDAVKLSATLTDDTFSETMEQLYSRVVQAVEPPPITPVQLETLRRVVTHSDIFPTRTVVELVNEGFVAAPQRLRDGKWRLTLTDKGREAITVTPAPSVDIDKVLAELPPAEREWETVIEGVMADAEQMVDKALEVWNNPPITDQGFDKLASYLGKVANHLDSRPDLMEKLRQAHQISGERANKLYEEFFINYDNRSTFDFVMQRFMPFWTYESRRWPRLVRLMGKRPVLAKHFTLIGGEEDYGYVPTPWGFEFHPAKGTIVSGLRRTLSRDYPELHEGWRGAVEESLDWFGRGGFYFVPPITAAAALFQGEPGSALPPPVSLIFHGFASAGVELPGVLGEVAFDSRYHQFIIDQVLADKFNRNPQEVKRLADEGITEAVGMVHAARIEAARRLIAMNQLSVLRYRPESKREFIKDSESAVEEFIGISVEDQKVLKRLGISVYEIVPVSRFQRRQMREHIPNYDAWVNSAISLRPAEEQKMIRKIDKFWSEMESAQSDFESQVAELSLQAERGFISGAEFRRSYSDLQKSRAAVINNLKSRPEFSDVPITQQERIEYAQRFNKPPQLVHPVDEVLESYYAVNPDNFKDEVTGEVDWRSFFETRESILNGVPEPVQSQVKDVLRGAKAPFEILLQDAAPYLREYYGVREELLRPLVERNPEVGQVYITYRRLQNLAKLTEDEEERAALTQEALKLSSRFPVIRQIETQVRFRREQMKRDDPNMRVYYEIFIQEPKEFPSVSRTRIARRGGLRPIRTL